jgi:hypothetical protein
MPSSLRGSFLAALLCVSLGLNLVQAAIRIEKPAKNEELALLKINNVHYTWARINRVICGATKADDLYFGSRFTQIFRIFSWTDRPSLWFLIVFKLQESATP